MIGITSKAAPTTDRGIACLVNPEARNLTEKLSKTASVVIRRIGMMGR